MDDADRVDERSEFDHLANLEKSHKPEAPKACGFCLFCEAPLHNESRWCDSDCRDDWEKFNAGKPGV